jgi:hypothetical protein
MSRNYKFHNPVEAGLGFRPKDYMYSNAIDYSGGTDLLDGLC